MGGRRKECGREVRQGGRTAVNGMVRVTIAHDRASSVVGVLSVVAKIPVKKRVLGQKYLSRKESLGQKCLSRKESWGGDAVHREGVQ